MAKVLNGWRASWPNMAWATFVLPMVLAASLAGCGKADLNELVDQAKKKAVASGEMVSQAVDQTVDRASERLGQGAEVLNLAGDMQLTAGQPLSTKACYARVVKVGGGRPQILQLASYREPSQETFPAVFAQAQMAGESGQLAPGQTMSADMFLQRESNGPVLFTAADSVIELKVTEVNGTLATIEVVSGELLDPQSGQPVPLTGTLHAVLP